MPLIETDLDLPLIETDLEESFKVVNIEDIFRFGPIGRAVNAPVPSAFKVARLTDELEAVREDTAREWFLGSPGRPNDPYTYNEFSDGIYDPHGSHDERVDLHTSQSDDADDTVHAKDFSRHFPTKLQPHKQAGCARCSTLISYGCQDCDAMLCCIWRPHNVPETGEVMYATCNGLFHHHGRKNVSPNETRRGAPPKLVVGTHDLGRTHLSHAPLSLNTLRKNKTPDPRGGTAPCVLCGNHTAYVCPCRDCTDGNDLPSALCWNTTNCHGSTGETSFCFVRYHEELTRSGREALRRVQERQTFCPDNVLAEYLDVLERYRWDRN